MRKAAIPLIIFLAVSAAVLTAGLARKRAADRWRTLISQGTTYHTDGRDGQAEACLKEAATLAEKMHYGDAVLGQTLNNLGEVYARQGRYSEAATTLTRALALRRKAYGPNSYETAITLRNLAGVMDDRGQYDLALDMQIHAMRIAKAAKGPDYPEAAVFRIDLGCIYIHLQDYPKAESTLRDALKISRSHKDGRSVASATNALAYVIALEGRFKEAEPLARRAIALSNAFGSSRYMALAAQSNLGRALQGQHRYDEARKVYENALKSSLDTLGRDHPSTALLQESLSTVLLHVREYAKAEQLARDALRTSEKAVGPLHHDTILTRYNLVEALRYQHKYDEAEQLFNIQIAEAEKHRGPMSAMLAGTLEDYAQFLRRINRNRDAGQAASRAKKIRTERHRRRLPDVDAPPAFPVASSCDLIFLSSEKRPIAYA